METLKFGIVGLGHIAEKAYLGAITRVEGAKAAAVCDIDRQRADAWSSKLHVPSYHSVIDMLDSEKLDFLINLTPHNVHANVINEAARRGVHVFTEKPVVNSLAEAAAVKMLVESSGIKLMVALQRRFSKAHNDFHEMAKSVGNPFFVEARYTRYINGPGDGWRGSRKLAGGGCLIDMGYHMIDLIIWHFGLPDMVCMESSTKAAPWTDYDAEDTALVMFNYKSGLYGMLFLSRAYRPEEEYLRLTGSSGSCIIDRQVARMLGKDGSIVAEEQVDYDMVELVRKQLKHFVAAIREDTEPFTGMGYNMQHMAFVDACYRSKTAGAYVSVSHMVESAKEKMR